MRRRAFLYASVRHSVRTFFIASLGLALAACATFSSAYSAEWIWSPEHEAGEVPVGACYFRKAFPGGEFERATLTVAGDDSFEVYLNGRRIIQGSGWEKPKTYNILPLVGRGNNVLAVKVTNDDVGPAGFVATVKLTDKDGGVAQHVTDESWKTSLRPLAFWHLPRYSDARWSNAQSLGQDGQTAP